MKKYKIFVVYSVGWSMLALVPLGCSSGMSPTTYAPPGEGPHIAQAAAHVVKYLGLTENRKKTPKDTSEMKDWAAKNNIPEDDLVSTRDHEPYQIHELSKGAVIVITETTGVKGKRFMFSHRQGQRAPVGSEATEEEIDNALKSAPSTGRRGGRPG